MEDCQFVVNRVREFNRFYTVILGMLDRRYLGSDYSVAETRILFELYTHDGCTANALSASLQLDKSYLSRILKRFEADGLLEKTPSAQDSRARLLHLTRRGAQQTAQLIEQTNRQILPMVEPLTTGQRAGLCAAMDHITQCFSRQGATCGGPVIRAYRMGDPSRVCDFYTRLYEKQFHFHGSVERYFLAGMVELFDDPTGSCLWVAEQNGEIVGSVAVVKKADHLGQLRWFGVDTSMQGQGLGRRLLETAMQFCRRQGYTDLFLWTIDILKPARHLYGKFGFAPTETKPNNEWADSTLLEEKWEYHEK